MAAPIATTRAEALSGVTLPTRDARRTAHRAVDDLPRGLDASVEGLRGLWSRRSEVTRRLLNEAQSIDEQRGDWQDLSDARLRARMIELRMLFRRGGHSLQPEVEQAALAAVREVALRRLGLLPFVVQLAGALALRRGFLAEMATGEGKTLTAALAAVLAGWTGRPCHVVTVNDYLAQRDTERMGAIFRFCGLTVDVVTGSMEPPARRRAYAADVTYTTSKEVVADFLRDRLQLGPLVDAQRRNLRRLLAGGEGSRDGAVMRGLHTAIIDEADSVLIDEAVTPLIISRENPNPELEAACQAASGWAADFVRGRDYRLDEAVKQVDFLPAGNERLAAGGGILSGIWRGPARRAELVRQALLAREYFHRDKQYVVVDGKVVIVDEFTGRMMPGRTWREGLHQAVEAKEGIAVSAPSETLARISFQRFFRFYEKLSGMTGTAAEAAAELWQVYALPVITIPTNRPCIRLQEPDEFFATADEKWLAVAATVTDLYAQGKPVLVGTRHITSSERLASLLRERGIPFNLLHAIHHREEARIVAEAGKAGRVTIATNMAGRGTDIQLDEDVARSGGLTVIATERHESLRIDRQLFGRCARQGDPGCARVFVSLEDDLLRRHLPHAVCRMIGAQLRHKRPAAYTAALAAVRCAQYRAQRQAYMQRRQVLRTDHWIDEALSFTGRANS